MRMRERVYDFLFYSIVGTLYCFALSAAIFDAMIVTVPYPRLFVLALGFMLFFFVLFYNRWTMLGVGCVALLAGIVVFVMLWRQNFEAEWFESLRTFTREVVLFYRGVVAYREEYGQVLPVVATGLIAFLAALNLRLEFNFYLLMLLGVGVIAVPIWADWGGSPVAIPVFLFCFLVMLAKRLNLFPLVRGTGKHGRNDGFTLVMIPVSLFALVVGSLIPAPDFAFSPIGAPTDTPDSLFDFAGDLFGARGDATTAYSEDGSRLGGPNERTEELIMEVKADERVYLTGTVRDTYTGSSWTMSDKARDDVPRGDDGSYKTSAYSEELQGRQDYWMRYYAQPERSVTVYTATRTKTLFTPPFRHELWFGDDDFTNRNEMQMSASGALSAKKAVERNVSYGQRYSGFDFTNSYIIGVLRESDAPDPGDEALASYLALPDTLPGRVEELAGELTAPYGNNYDRLRAIERHLAQFPYTLMPDNVPRSEDFVDYFLFTGQEGYCVYFASAMAVMARAVDIPTRYVEGYVMPPERQENGNFRVTTLQAHAWVEAFFPGFGWVPFEPTPPSYAELYGEDPVSEEPPALPDDVLDDEDELPGETDPPGPDEADDDSASQPPEQPDDPEGRPQSDDDMADADGQVEDKPVSAVLVALLSLLAMVGLSALFVWVMRRAYRRKFARLERLPEREAVTGYFACVLHVAAALDYPIRRGETAHAYAARVGEQLVFAEDVVNMEALADIFARAAYSEQPVPTEDAVLMKRCYRELLQQLQQTKQGKLRYLVNRYLLMRF